MSPEVAHRCTAVAGRGSSCTGRCLSVPTRDQAFKAHKYGPDNLADRIEVAGVDHTVLCSDLGLTGSPRHGYRAIVRQLLDLQFAGADIRRMISRNAAGLLNMAPQAAAKVA